MDTIITTLYHLSRSENPILRLYAMIGARNFVKHDENTVSFRFMNGAKNKANYIKISLNEKDLYDIKFGLIRGVNYKDIEEINDVFAEDLQRIFEESTALYLTI